MSHHCLMARQTWFLTSCAFYHYYLNTCIFTLSRNCTGALALHRGTHQDSSPRISFARGMEQSSADRHPCHLCQHLQPPASPAIPLAAPARRTAYLPFCYNAGRPDRFLQRCTPLVPSIRTDLADLEQRRPHTTRHGPICQPTPHPTSHGVSAVITDHHQPSRLRHNARLHPSNTSNTIQ